MASNYSSDDKDDLLTGPGSGSPEPESGFEPGRRKVMLAGALLVPTIITLHGTPAWAQTDYTMTAYKYGTHKGQCRNPDYIEGAPPASPRGQKFVDCPGGRPEKVTDSSLQG